jgi:Fic family protein
MPSPDLLYRGFPDFAAWGPLTAEDRDLWDRFASSLELRRQGATPEALRQAVDVAVRAAALDTGAIEGLYDVDRGFTMTVAVQGLAWEQMIEERGKGVRALFEAQLQAYELVLDAATRRQPLTEAWLRSLHEVLCAPQATYRVLTSQGWQEHDLLKGEYKRQPNHVRLKDGTVHAYAPVDQVPAEMHRLVEQTRTPAFESAHPVLQAAYVHYALVVIHPFADGNGRVARALASIFFYRAGSIPFLVFANQRLAYFDALHAADLGNSGHLLAFFRDRGIDTMQLVTEGLMTAVAPDPRAIGETIEGLLAQGVILSPHESESLIGRLVHEIRTILEAKLSQPGLSDALTGSFSYHPQGLSLYLDARSPRSVQEQMIVTIHPLAPPSPFAFRIEPGTPDALDVRLEDVRPELTTSLKLRLDAWAQRQLGRLASAIEAKLR